MSERYHFPEPCLCGDPECRRCFPHVPEVYEDEDYYDDTTGGFIDDEEENR